MVLVNIFLLPGSQTKKFFFPFLSSMKEEASHKKQPLRGETIFAHFGCDEKISQIQIDKKSPQKIQKKQFICRRIIEKSRNQRRKISIFLDFLLVIDILVRTKTCFFVGKTFFPIKKVSETWAVIMCIISTVRRIYSSLSHTGS